MTIKKIIYSIFFLSTIILTCLSLEAGVITPELSSVLSFLAPDEEVSIIINLSEKTDLRLLKEEKDKHRRRHQIIQELRDRADLTQGPLKTLLQVRGAKRMIPLWIINGIAATVPTWTVTELADFPGVESVTLDAVIQAPPVTLATAGPPEWNMTAIKAPELWSLGITGIGVVVANMDTGVDVNHPDLQSKWRGGLNSWYDPYNATTTPYDLAGSSTGHGTGTMGVMVGGDAGGTSIGVAPGAQWIAAKIFNDQGTSTETNIHGAFQWLLDPDGDFRTNDAPDVVNASWGFDDNPNSCITEFRDDVQALKAAGIAVVFSAGNSGPDPSTSVSPANNPGAFAVGSVDQSLLIAPSSSRGPSFCDGSIFPHVVAPGENIRVADLQLIPSPPAPPAYTSLSGTSFAAPHVSGAMALLLSAFPDLTVSELELILKESAFDLGATGPDNDYGNGLIDALSAYGNVLSAISADTIGIYRSSNARFYLRNSNSTGGADVPPFQYGIFGDIPIAGDWDGNGTITIGVYRPSNRKFYLRNSNDTGIADISPFQFGVPGDIPIVGDWDGNGTTTIGVYRPSNRKFYLRNSNDTGFADIPPFQFGIPGDTPIVGDWDGNGTTTIGVYRPSNQKFYLRNSNDTGFADIPPFQFGISGDMPIAGDWDGNGTTTIGAYRPTNAKFYLRNSNSTGPASISFYFGIPGDTPIIGNWDGLP